MMDETRVRKLMRTFGVSQEPVPEVDRVILSMKDGSWWEFTGAQVMRLTMRSSSLFQIKGEPKRIVDFPALFGTLFPEGCKYL
jgi:NACalpha-BTF3-like transcription factor